MAKHGQTVYVVSVCVIQAETRMMHVYLQRVYLYHFGGHFFPSLSAACLSILSLSGTTFSITIVLQLVTR